MFTKLKEIHELFGCAVINIANLNTEIPISYSLGFAAYGLPDVIITGSGLSYEVRTQIINNVLKLWRESGFQLGVIEKLTEESSLKLVPVQREYGSDFFLQAPAFYTVFPELAKPTVCNLSYVQILRPDENGLFPYDPNYLDIHCQTLLPLIKGCSGFGEY